MPRQLALRAALVLPILLGAVPLMLGTGTGSELRHPLGLTIVGGLIVSQMLTLFTTPVVYLYLERFRLFSKRQLRLVRTQPAADHGR